MKRTAIGVTLVAVVAASAACAPKKQASSTDDDQRRADQQREALHKLTDLALPTTPAAPAVGPVDPVATTDAAARIAATLPSKPLPAIAVRPLAQLVPAKPGSFGRTATLLPTMSMAQATAQLRDVSVDPAAVFARVAGHARCELDISATYDLFARMNSDDAGVALMFERDNDPPTLVEYSIVVPSNAAELLTQKWGPPSKNGLWFDAAGLWQISTSEMACGDIVFPTIRFVVRPLTRAELLGREILRWFGQPLTAQLSTVEIERTPAVTDTAEATEQMDGSFEIDAADGAVMGTISADASNKVVAVELTFATSERSDQRLMMRDLTRLWGKPTVEVTDDGDIGVVFHKPGFKIYGADTGNESWVFTISR